MAAPKVYSYHPETGAYLGTGIADASPLQPGIFLDPAFSTRIPVPTIPSKRAAVFSDGAWKLVHDRRGETWWKDGYSFRIEGLGDPASAGFSPNGPPVPGLDEAVVWENGGWVIKPDYRGQVWYEGHNQPVIVTDIGDPADLGWTLENPPAPDPEPEPEPEPPTTIEGALAVKFAELDAKRRSVEEGGIVFAGMPLKTDRQTAAIVTAAYIKAKENSAFAIANWKFSNGVFAPLNAATIIAAGDAISAHVQSAFDREAALSAELLAFSTVEEINGFDISAEW